MSDTQYDESKNAMDIFCADLRHIRFKEDSDSNWAVLNEFLNERSLEPTADNLHFAFESLVREDKLDLMPLGKIGDPPPVAQPAPQPVAVPAVPSPPRREFTIFRNGKKLIQTL